MLLTSLTLRSIETKPEQSSADSATSREGGLTSVATPLRLHVLTGGVAGWDQELTAELTEARADATVATNPSEVGQRMKLRCRKRPLIFDRITKKKKTAELTRLDSAGQVE